MPQNEPIVANLFSAVTATGVSTKFPCAGYVNIGLDVTGAGTASGTVKIRGAFSKNVVLSSAASATNPWFYVGYWNLDSGVFTSGDTGLVVAANGTFGLLVNVDGLQSLAAEISAYTSGNFTVNANASADA